MLRRVAELFKDHADLLRGFTYFLPDNPEEDGMETFHVDASTVEIPAASLADLERDLREAKARYSNGDAAAKKEVEHLLRALHARRDPEKIKRGAGPCRMSNESK